MLDFRGLSQNFRAAGGGASGMVHVHAAMRRPSKHFQGLGDTGLESVTSCVLSRRSSQLSQPPLALQHKHRQKRHVVLGAMHAEKNRRFRAKDLPLFWGMHPRQRTNCSEPLKLVAVSSRMPSSGCVSPKTHSAVDRGYASVWTLSLLIRRDGNAS